MTVAPTPSEIFERAVEEGERRLDQSTLELAATSFIAGFTIVFAVVALGIVHATVEPAFGEAARVAGSLAFGVGLVFLIVGRTELFNENFFDPAARAVEAEGPWLLGPLARLWALTFAFNFAGGFLFALVFAVEGVLPTGIPEALVTVAEETARRSVTAGLASAVVGGALVALLSYLLQAVNSVVGRALMAFFVGFLLALGPFDHVIVTAIHLFFGILFGAEFGYAALAETTVVATAGNLVGGLGLVTLTHVAQVIGAEESGGSE